MLRFRSVAAVCCLLLPLAVVPASAAFECQRLSVSAVADHNPAFMGEQDGWTISITGFGPVGVQSITATLPPGFSYLPGSTSGATTDDPTGTPDLKWTGPFTLGAGETLQLHFLADVTDTPGTYDLALRVTDDQGLTCLGRDGPVTVSPFAKRADAPVSGVSTDNGYTLFYVNSGTTDVVVASFVETLPFDFTYVPGSTSGVTTADPVDDGSGSLEWPGPFVVKPGQTAELHIRVRVASFEGTFTNFAAACSSFQRICATYTGADVQVVRLPVTTAKTADLQDVPAGATDGYTISFTNPNGVAVQMGSIYDDLPDGFSYLSGSTTGATTADPVVTGQRLTWTGTFVVPAQATLSMHFKVTVAGIPGLYLNEAGAIKGLCRDGENCDPSDSVQPTGPTAPIRVRHLPLTVAKTASEPSVEVGEAVGFTISVANPNEVPVALTSISDTLPPGFTYAPNTTSGVTSSNPSISGQTLTWTGSFTVPASTRSRCPS